MVNVREVYKKDRITAQEIANAIIPEQKKAIILGVNVGSRTYKEQEYNYIELEVEMNRERRKINLSEQNALELAKSIGEDTDKWLNYIILLHANKDEKGIYRLGLSVWGRA